MNTEDLIPPQALDVERTVLGSMLIDADVLAIGATRLVPGCFYATQNRTIFESMTTMSANGMSVDVLTLAEHLRTREQLEAIGAEPYLSELMSSTATSANIDGHIKILFEKMIRRQIIKSSSHLQDLGFDDNMPAETLFTLMEQQVGMIGKDFETAEMGITNRARVVSIEELRPQVENYYKKGESENVYRLALENLANLYKPTLGQFNVITGLPGSGKTELSQSIVLDLAYNHGWKWLIFSPESYPYYYLIQNFIEKYSKKGFHRGSDRVTPEELEAGIRFLHERIKLIDVGDDRVNTDQITKIIRDYTDKNECHGILIDPFNCLDVSIQQNENRTYGIGRFLDRLRILGRRRKFSSYILAHPKNLIKDPKTHRYPVARLGDIDGGAIWWDMAYNGMSVYRYYKLDVIAVHVQKIKFKPHGEVGVCYLKYDRDNGVFTPYYPDKDPAVIEKELAEQQGMDF